MKVPLGNLKDRHVFCCPFFRTLTLVIATRLLKSLNCKLLQKYSISKIAKKKKLITILIFRPITVESNIVEFYL